MSRIRITPLADQDLVEIWPDIAKALRYHPVGNYLLLYRVIPNGIELVRVVHGARDLQQLF